MVCAHINNYQKMQKKNEVTVSVLTPSIRPDRLGITEKALLQQTIPFEWLVGSPFKPKEKSAIWVEDDFEFGLWTMGRIMNRLIKKASGSLIISMQDSIWAAPDTLERFLSHFEREPNTLVGAVGNQYDRLDKYGIPVNQVWQDPRIRTDQGTFYGCYHQDIEFNLASIPRKAFYSVGGYDEEADMKFVGMGHLSVTQRLTDQGGWDFKLDQTIKTKSLVHGRIADWDKKNGIHGPYFDRIEEIKKFPHYPILTYLK